MKNIGPNFTSDQLYEIKLLSILQELCETEEIFLKDFEFVALQKSNQQQQSDGQSFIEANKLLTDIYYFHKINFYPNLKLCDLELKKIIDIFISTIDDNLFNLYISFSLYIPQPKLIYKKYPMKRLKEYLNIFEALLTLLESYPEVQYSYATILEKCYSVKQKLHDTLMMMKMALEYNSVHFNQQKSLVCKIDIYFWKNSLNINCLNFLIARYT